MSALELHAVSKSFRRRSGLWPWSRREKSTSVRALDKVGLAVDAGEVHVLLGPNGSGKTTLLKIISTILLPDAGQVLVSGTDAEREPDRVRRQVGFAIANERSFFQRLTVRENLDFFATLENVPRRVRPERVSWAMEQAGVGAFADTLAYQLSSGMQQRAAVARALLKGPAVLLLDEPTRSIDPGRAVRFWELVRRLARSGTAVLLATHNFEEACAVGDVVGVLRRGALVAQQRVTAATSVESLRSFYFSEVENGAETEEAVP
jgi:ABC-2 type transport system ATP-binding protein